MNELSLAGIHKLYTIVNNLSNRLSIERAWEWIMMDCAFDVPETEFRSFQDRLSAQDIAIVESRKPELLPLDLQAELHLQCDRVSIAYRQWLNKLGLTYGTA